MSYLKVLIFFISSAFFIAENIHADEYIAFSLKVTQQMILSTPQDKDYRKQHPAVFTLGGITAMKGLVYDRKTGDLILVGQRDPERAILTLDDFVVALRAWFIHGKWPLVSYDPTPTRINKSKTGKTYLSVSIDPTPDTEKTQMQVVHFEGGIEDTQFGQDLLNSYCHLLQLKEGIVYSGIDVVKSYREIFIEQGEKLSSNLESGFWFFPLFPHVSIKEDVVAIKKLKVGVFTKVLYAEINGYRVICSNTGSNTLRLRDDVAADKFAKAVSDNFEKLAMKYYPFSRLIGLYEMSSLLRGIEELDSKPDLAFWLKNYQVKKANTPKEINPLKWMEDEDYELRYAGVVYSDYKELPSGVKLMAIALRLKAGDEMALKEVVLGTRPEPDGLSWGFKIEEEKILTASKIIFPSIKVVSYSEKERMKPCSTAPSVVKQRPSSTIKDMEKETFEKGLEFFQLADFEKAVEFFDKSLVDNPGFTLGSVNK